jgi:hypothetical protein
MVMAMDTHLKLLAEASLQVTAAEEAITETAYQNAREALDLAEEQLAELREGWPTMSASERTIIAGTATPLKARIDAATKLIPKRTTLTEVAMEADPEEDVEPAA